MSRHGAIIPPRLGYNPALDGLRGIAVLVVVIYHLWTPVLPAGYLGVDIFFVLSGFLITTLLLEERAVTGRISLRRFYARRALRLMPALVVVVVVCTGYSLAHSDWWIAGKTLSAIPFTLTYTTNWAAGHHVDLGMLSHTWSLSIEEQFYLLWPLLLIGLLARRGPGLALIACVLGLVVAMAVRVHLAIDGAYWLRTYTGFDTRADALLAGCGLALAHHLGLLTRIGRRTTAVSAILCAGALAMAMLPTIGGRSDWRAPMPWRMSAFINGGFTAFDLCAAVVIGGVVLAAPKVLTRLLSGRPLVALGRVSYGVYLWHFPVMRVLYFGTTPTYNPGPAQFALVMAVSWGLAWVSHGVVEMPFLRLKGRLGGAAAKPRRGLPGPSRRLDDAPV